MCHHQGRVSTSRGGSTPWILTHAAQKDIITCAYTDTFLSVLSHPVESLHYPRERIPLSVSNSFDMAAAEDMFCQGGLLPSPHRARSRRVSMYEIAATSRNGNYELDCQVPEGEGTPAEVALSGAADEYSSLYPVYLYCKRSGNGASMYPLTPFYTRKKDGRRVAIFASALHAATTILGEIPSFLLPLFLPVHGSLCHIRKHFGGR